MNLHHSLKLLPPEKRKSHLIEVFRNKAPKTPLERLEQEADDYLANFNSAQRKTETIKSNGVGLFSGSQAFKDIQQRAERLKRK